MARQDLLGDAMNVTQKITLEPIAPSGQQEWRPAGLNGWMIQWVWAKPRGRARRAKQTKVAAKVEKAERGQRVEITEATGYRLELRSRGQVDFLSRLSISIPTPGTTMARALSLGPS